MFIVEVFLLLESNIHISFCN